MTRSSDRDHLSFIDPHDSSIARVTISIGTMVAEFERLLIYERTANEQCDIWIYRATLTLSGVTLVTVQGPAGSVSNLDDGDIYHSGPALLEWRDLLDQREIERLVLVFASGAVLEVSCAAAHLVLGERLRYLETWHGPLS